jgi:ABC-2 type transport system permease protein
LSLVSELADSRELLSNLTSRELRGKYKTTALGYLWSLINPLAQMAIYTAVFSFILRVEPEPGDPSGLDIFPLWLLCGLLPWGFFAAVVSGGMNSIVGNAALILKVWFRRVVLPTSSMLAALVTFGVEMIVLTIVLLLVGGMPLPFLPLVAVTMVLLGVFALGIGMALAVANVYFRDTPHLVAIFLQVWFFATPIIYPSTLVTDQVASTPYAWVARLYEANPMVAFVEVFRALLYDNRLPDLGPSLYCLALAGASISIGYWVFRRREPVLAEEL